MGLLFDKLNRVITVEEPATEITIQNLLNVIRQWEDELSSMDIGIVASAAGKEPLGGGVIVGITLTLLNNWRLAFEARLGSSYIQCKVSGGNLVGSHPDGVIFPTAFTQIVMTASSSATLQELASIQYSSFNGGVTIDVVDGEAGTAFPVGTPKQPVDNMTDALSIASDRGFTIFFIMGDATLNDSLDFEEHLFVGESPNKSHFTILDNAGVIGCEFTDAEVTGILDGGNVIKNCLVHNITYVNGYIEQCILGTGDIVLGGNQEAHFLDCWSGVVGLDTPTIDMGGSGQELGIRNYNGGIRLKNKTGPDKVSIDLNSGQVVITDTVVSGEVVIRGIGKVTDNSGPGCTVNTDDFLNPAAIAARTWNEQKDEYTVSGTYGKLVNDIKSGTDDIEVYMVRALGLAQENYYLDQTNYTTYQGIKLLTSGRLRIYSVSGSVGTDSDVIATYNIVSSWTGDELNTYKVTKI